jgi:hypothetical protein
MKFTPSTVAVLEKAIPLLAKVQGAVNAPMQVFVWYSTWSVSIVTGYGLDIKGSIPGRGKRFFFSPQHPDWILGQPTLLSNGYWGLFPLG